MSSNVLEAIVTSTCCLKLPVLRGCHHLYLYTKFRPQSGSEVWEEARNTSESRPCLSFDKVKEKLGERRKSVTLSWLGIYKHLTLEDLTGAMAL